MSEREKTQETFFVPRHEDDHTLPDHSPFEDVPLIGHDDPTVRTTALPDHGIDSAIHDVSQLRRSSRA